MKKQKELITQTEYNRRRDQMAKEYKREQLKDTIWTWIIVCTMIGFFLFMALMAV